MSEADPATDAATSVHCTRCGAESAPALERAPFPTELGERVLRHTCRDCWQAWRAMAIKIINEYRLSLVDPAHQDALMEQLAIFLKLPGTDAEATNVEVGTPPAP
ncbi:MAG: Fe-S cluster protector protein [Planctomycetota bacterium]|nr:MAG: Fe-S cluster protector protein [Planctomycetota bacterium]